MEQHLFNLEILFVKDCVVFLTMGDERFERPSNSEEDLSSSYILCCFLRG